MKKVVTALAICGLMVAGAQQSHAGDREWATAGKVLTGVIAGAVIAKSFEPAPVVYQPAPVVYQSAPVVYQPAPVIVHHPRVVYTQPMVHPAPAVCHPAPVVCAPAPVIMRPAHVYHAPPPVVSYHYSFGHRPRHRVCW